MIKYLFLIFSLLSFEAFGAPKVTIKFNTSKIKQGSVVDAVLGLNSETTQKIQYNQLKGQTLGGSFYIHQAKPLMTKGSWDTLESDAKIIVVKIPENKPLIHKLGEDSIEVTWTDVEFVPTEVPKDFIFGTFEVPSRMDVIKWLLIVSGFVLTVGLIFYVYQKLKNRSHIKQRRKALKTELFSATEYDQVVELWKKRDVFIKEFPFIEEQFRKLETVLYKYQFKPKQTEAEKSEVMRSYKLFVTDIQGGFRGI